ncbi:hypothetical protein [Fredinandcohnia quinoae]|uniref:Uncharacterized protein n=1 Tax=Fredinandcohnia quinoae TaxID=2918902 RepID=A0AAW5E3T2_9BACI|nr:hypothetical protein [Fredinandcohnia sp. SECRCQ15]MCH1624562.1 hypothetical protein [Fredinandcohnia sp. SECRCQ15]
MKDQQFLSLIKQINEPFSGWDFKYVTDTERIKSVLLSWSYAIPWQVPGFEPKKFIDSLYLIHKIIEEKGFFDVKQHRFIIQTKAG